MLKKLEHIQRIFTRKLYRKTYPNEVCPTYSDRLKLFGLNTIESLCIKTDLLLLYKIVNKLLNISFNPTLSILKPSRFIFKRCSTKVYQNCFFHRSLTLWNKLISDKIDSPLVPAPVFHSLLSVSQSHFSFGSASKA